MEILSSDVYVRKLYLPIVSLYLIRSENNSVFISFLILINKSYCHLLWKTYEGNNVIQESGCFVWHEQFPQWMSRTSRSSNKGFSVEILEQLLDNYWKWDGNLLFWFHKDVDHCIIFRWQSMNHSYVFFVNCHVNFFYVIQRLFALKIVYLLLWKEALGMCVYACLFCIFYERYFFFNTSVNILMTYWV